MKNKRISLFVVFLMTFLYFECCFRIFAVQTFFSPSFWEMLFYLSFLSFLFTLLCSWGHRKTNRHLSNILMILFTIWYGAAIIFKRSFHVYFSISTTLLADQMLSFLDKFFEILGRNIVPILFLIVPFLLVIFFPKKIDYTKKTKQSCFRFGAFAVISYCLFFGFLFFSKDNINSPYQLYISLNNNALNNETFGGVPSVFIEVRKMLFPSHKLFYGTNTPKPDAVPIIYEKNILDINFEQLLDTEKDSKVQEMHQYFLNDNGTLKNEYTGYFKDKNLILIMAESFNSIAVSNTLTPTLYKLTQEGFSFENFYSPVILSTIGGEFQELTGLYPNLTMLSRIWRKGTNYYPFGFGNVFSKLGYTTHAYHNHKYQFQDRNVYLNSIGLSHYLGCGNGLEKRLDCASWPESDLEMMSTTVSDYVNQEKFFTYYVTVSGHMSYNFSNNDMARKNQDKVSDLPYSTDIRAYLAANMELDKALESLLGELEKSGKLDDTVIALVGDHYPYDISIEHINEVAEPNRDEAIEVNKSHFILWNSKMETKLIKKVGGNMDVLPTILNLFDIPYDSRLIMGKDLLSSSEGLVIFQDQSWISDEGKYVASTNTFLPNDGEKDYNGYVEKMNQIVTNRVNLSKLILEKDYYRKVLGE